MTITFDAVYENGVLKPAQPLPLKDLEQVSVTIQPKSNWVTETYGIIGWKGSSEDLEHFAMDGDLDFPPPAEAP
jgi:predicted DNA-binding antitoxin AbrB/MazE fold protein